MATIRKKATYFFVGFVAILLIGFPYYSKFLLPGKYRGLEMSPGAPQVDFFLKDIQNRSVRLEDLRGRYLYVFFGYSRCAGVCPRALGQLLEFARTTLAHRSGGPDFKIAFLSIDPARDRPEHLSAFFTSFGDRFLVLRDGQEPVTAVARRFGYFYSLPNADTIDYQIQHPEILYMLDPSGKPLLLYSQVNAGDLAHDWNILSQSMEPGL